MGKSVATKEQTYYQIITIQEASQYTGLAVKTLYAMVSQRRIPHVKVGRLLRFDVGLLNQWLQEQTVLPMPTKIV
ncbi:helix-turn-helix domain-containing protein [Nitrospira sp. MA-1]|nr:helix-turn-helix domain-containing protein [Nitrospira sp. MA-1]